MADASAHGDRERINRRLDCIDVTLTKILSQTTLTNGKVAQLRHDVYGNPNLHLPSGERDRGLVGKVHDQGVIVAKVDELLKVAKWVAVTFFGAFVAGVGSIVANLL